MKPAMLAGALALALTTGACQTAQTSSTAWGQIAVAAGQIIGETRIDPTIDKVSAKLARYCTAAQVAANAVDLFAPDKLQQAATAARATVETFCAAPPHSVAEAVAAVASAINAIEHAKTGG